jgi:hypothetical protein
MTTKPDELWVDLLAIPVAKLESMLKLLKEREQLIKRLDAITAVMDKPSKVQPKHESKKPSPFRDALVCELSRFPRGRAVADLAKAVGRSTKSVHSYFSSYGKKCGLFVKVEPGVWALA